MLATMEHRDTSESEAVGRRGEALEGYSFVDYLLGPYVRGYDWTPDRPPSGVLQIHHQARGAGGGFVRTEAGKPAMRRTFERWLDGKIANVPGVDRATVERAIVRAKQVNPEAIAVLEWRQQRPGVNKATQAKFMLEQGIYSPGTLTKRFRRAVELVVDFVCEEWRDGR